MILYLILQGIDTLLFGVVSLFPTIETPIWIVETLPQVLRVIYGFNVYLPVYEAFIAVFFCIASTIVIRVFSIVASLVHLNI